MNSWHHLEERREHLMAQGLCGDCGQPRSERSTRRCDQCLDRNNTHQRRKRRDKRHRDEEYRRANMRRQQRIRDGYCNKCMRRPPIEGLMLCAACSERARARNKRIRDARRAEGLCTSCGDERDRPGLLTCSGCVQYENMLEEKRRRRGMPAMVRRAGNKWRVVEPSGKLVRGPNGTPVDGGGHDTKNDAKRQARAINARERK